MNILDKWSTLFNRRLRGITLGLALLTLVMIFHCGAAVAYTGACSKQVKIVRSGNVSEEVDRYGLCEFSKGRIDRWIVPATYDFILPFNDRFLARKNLSSPGAYETTILDKNGMAVKANINGWLIGGLPVGGKRFVVVTPRNDVTNEDVTRENAAIASEINAGKHKYDRVKKIGVDVLRTIPRTTVVATQYDKNGKILSTNIQPSINPRLSTYDENHIVAVGANSKVGLLDITGRWSVEPRYSFIGYIPALTRTEKPYWLFMTTDCGRFVCSRHAEFRAPDGFKVMSQWSDQVYVNPAIRDALADVEDGLEKLQEPKNLEILFVLFVSLVIFGATYSYYHYYKNESRSYAFIHAIVFMLTAAFAIAVSILFLALIFAAPLALASYRRD